MGANTIIATWPEGARRDAQRVISAYGEPHEATDSELTWLNVGTWRRVVAGSAATLRLERMQRSPSVASLPRRDERGEAR